MKRRTSLLNQMGLSIPLSITLIELTGMDLNVILKSMRSITDKTQQSWKILPKQKVVARNRFIIIQLGIILRDSSRKNCIVKKALVSTLNGKIDVEPVFVRLKCVFGVRRGHVRGGQAVQTEIGCLFMSMNLTKLAKNLAAKGTKL